MFDFKRIYMEDVFLDEVGGIFLDRKENFFKYDIYECFLTREGWLEVVVVKIDAGLVVLEDIYFSCIVIWFIVVLIEFRLRNGIFFWI